MQSLDGQTALVTGAGSGIGRGIALVLASEGARIAVVDLDAQRAAAVAAAVSELGGKAVPVTAHVSVARDVARAVEETVEWSGRLDILASNAGIFPEAALEELDEKTWDRVMAVNVKSAFLLLRAARLMTPSALHPPARLDPHRHPGRDTAFTHPGGWLTLDSPLPAQPASRSP